MPPENTLPAPRRKLTREELLAGKCFADDIVERLDPRFKRPDDLLEKIMKTSPITHPGELHPGTDGPLVSAAELGALELRVTDLKSQIEIERRTWSRMVDLIQETQDRLVSARRDRDRLSEEVQGLRAQTAQLQEETVRLQKQFEGLNELLNRKVSLMDLLSAAS